MAPSCCLTRFCCTRPPPQYYIDSSAVLARLYRDKRGLKGKQAPFEKGAKYGNEVMEVREVVDFNRSILPRLG